MLSFPPSPSVRSFVARQPVDLRKGFDGLSGEVIDVIEEVPRSGHRFVFFNRRRDQMKGLVWNGSGFWLLYKRLEHGRFQVFDRAAEGESFELTSTELELLLDGIDLRTTKDTRRVDEKRLVEERGSVAWCA